MKRPSSTRTRSRLRALVVPLLVAAFVAASVRERVARRHKGARRPGGGDGAGMMRDRSAVVGRHSRFGRNVQLARLGANVGTVYASTSARKVFASAERHDAPRPGT